MSEFVTFIYFMMSEIDIKNKILIIVYFISTIILVGSAIFDSIVIEKTKDNYKRIARSYEREILKLKEQLKKSNDDFDYISDLNTQLEKELRSKKEEIYNLRKVGNNHEEE